MVVNYKKSSPYYSTDQYNYFIPYLGFYSPRPVSQHSSDKIIRIGPEHEHRPDLLSYELYNTPDYWWVFMVRNPDLFQDPIYDLVSGMELMVPTKSRLLKILG